MTMATARRGLVLCAVWWLLAAAGCKSDKPVVYPTPRADAPLGVAYDAGTGTATFRVWAPAAGAASVAFFDGSTSTAAASTHPMTRDLSGGDLPTDLDQSGWNGVWLATVTGVAQGQLYQYLLGGVPVLDPYAPSMGQFDSPEPLPQPYQAGMGAVVDVAALPPLAASGAAVEDWAPFTAPPGYTRRDDAVIYEVHVRDFTMKLTTGLANPPGTYRALAERLAHVRDLGATHVQLLPVLAYYYGRESLRDTYEPTVAGKNAYNYNWGYDPQNYFSPEGMYSADPTDPALRVQELKALVNQAHKLGLGVILDVVYNHTVDMGVFEPLAPGYYFRGSGESGAGPDVATERKMVRKLVVDSIRHWTADYHVDGFRFDLMNLIDSRTILDAYAAASAVNPQVLFIGEGWQFGTLPATDWQGNPIVRADQRWVASTDAVSVFSDSFRDIIKGGGMNEGRNDNDGFVTLANVVKPDLVRNLRGDATNITPPPDAPGDMVQYLTAHDGLTLHDKLGKILRFKDAATPEADVFKAMRLAFVLQATAQGIAFLNGGCEFGRSKASTIAVKESTPANLPGLSYVKNSYDSSDDINAFDWTLLSPGTEGARLSTYVQGLYALRRSSDAFHLHAKALATTNVTLVDGTRPSAIAYRVVDVAGTTSFSIFVNAGTGPVTLATGTDLTAATVVVDDDEAGAAAVTSPSGFSTLTPSAVTVAARTAVVFRSGP
jgi:pullulanase/glycogen debranching enzyme